MTKTDTISRALRIVQQIADASQRGDRPAAQQARRTLDDLCAGGNGYPRRVRDALKAANLAASSALERNYRAACK